MNISFTKMQALGNDYIFIDNLAGALKHDPCEMAKALCKRRFSIGADGLIVLEGSKIADAKMRIFNADGSEAQMCGNAARCAGKLLYESNFTRKSHLTLETLAGVRDLYLNIKNGKIEKISVDMGKVSVLDMFLFEGAGEKFEMRGINVGNDHQVAFVPDVNYIDLDRLGSSFESNPRFTNGVNTEFCELVGENHLKVRVHERGVGETYACGTGACAAAVAAIVQGICSPTKQIIISMLGGELKVKCDETRTVRLLGDATNVFCGYVEL